MISVYNSIINYRGADIYGYLEAIGVSDVFDPLFPPYPEEEGFKEVLHEHVYSVISYILRAYSIDSDMISVGADWMKTKKKIFEAALVKPSTLLYEALVHLKSRAVILSINNWLEFQDDDMFTQLQMLKDLQVEMRITSVGPIWKASGEKDFDQKMKNAEYAIKLKSMIKDAESELIQNSVNLKDAIKEYKSIKKKATFGLETFLKES